MKHLLPALLALTLCIGCAATPFERRSTPNRTVKQQTSAETGRQSKVFPDNLLVDSESPGSGENIIKGGPFFVEAAWGFSTDGCGGGVIHDQPGSRYKAGMLTEIGIGHTTRLMPTENETAGLRGFGIRWHDYSMYVKQKGFRYGTLHVSSLHLTLEFFTGPAQDFQTGVGGHLLLSAGGGTAHFSKSGMLRHYDSAGSTYTDIEGTGEVISGIIGVGIDFYVQRNSSISLEYRYLEGWVSMDWKVINGPSTMLDDFGGLTMKQIHQIVLMFRVFF